MGSGVRIGRPIARAQHGRGGGQVATWVEGVLNAHAQPFQVAAVDLGEPQIEVGAPRQKCVGQACGVVCTARPPTRTRPRIHADGERVEAALHMGDRGQGFGRDRRGAGLGETEDGEQVEHDGLLDRAQQTAGRAGLRPAAAPRGIYCGSLFRRPSGRDVEASQATAWMRVRTPRRSQARIKCSSTVRGEMPSRSPIAAEVSPRAANSRQAVWRAVRRGADRGGEKRWSWTEVDMTPSKGCKRSHRQSVSPPRRPYGGGNAGGRAGIGL